MVSQKMHTVLENVQTPYTMADISNPKQTAAESKNVVDPHNVVKPDKNVVKRKKMLCLHGFGQSAKVFEARLSSFRNKIKSMR